VQGNLVDIQTHGRLSFRLQARIQTPCAFAINLRLHESEALPKINAVLTIKVQKKWRAYVKIPPFQNVLVKVMPQSSRYSDERVEQILAQLVQVLESNQAPTDLSLMVLGNMVTNLINTSVAPAQRRALARSFADALQASVREDKAH
jgi:uncharacterized protein YejL (UPF0352 family)